MIKDYCDILIQTIDTMIQGANEPQRMEYAKSGEKLELNEEQDSMLLVADPFVDMLQVEVYDTEEIKAEDIATITLPLWSLTNKNVNFDLLGVEGEFTTSPNQSEEQVDGSYGVQMIVYGGNKIYTVQLDSSEMLGDIKNFNHMLQKKVFDLTGVSGISYIGIKVYNNTNLNVIINNLRLLVGYNLTKVEETGSPLQLYSESDNLVYKTDFEDKIYEGEKQTLKVKYIYQEEGKYRAVSYLNVDSLPATAQLLWYRYNPSLPAGDMWGGPYWQNCALGEKENLFSREFDLNGELEQEKFKVVLLNADIAASTVTPIYSNEIVFTREKAEAEEYISDLKMRLADGSGGGYPYYDFDQLLATKHLHQSQIKREARIEFGTGYSNVDLLKQIKSVTWSWPVGVINGQAGDINGAALEQLESGGRASAIYFKFLEVDDEAAKLLLESLSKFNYQIPDFRDATNTDGNIECEIELVDGTKYQAFNLISLAVAGVSGTDYSIIARIVDGRGQMRRAVVPGQQFYLNVQVYDPKGEKIEIENSAVKASHYWTGSKIASDPLIVLPIIDDIDTSVPDAILLECAVETDLIIKEIVPIPITSDSSYAYLGPSKVMYSSEGNKPEYEDTPIQLKKDGMKVEEQVTGVTWTIDGDFIADNGENYGLAPKIYSNNYFQPVGIFDQIMTTEPIGVRGVIGNLTQWLQPIILYQNKYFSRIINDWNGALEINEEDGYILASAYVAGGKNEQNAFTGAILGELGTIENGTDSDAAPDPERTGLFGYKEGTQTFGFKADGTGFIGASGRGRINFDGINGAIYSGNFDGFGGQPAFKVDENGIELKDENDNRIPNKEHPDHSLDNSVLPNKLGEKGTYLNLTDGLFITNNGKFRGSITVGGGYSYEDDEGNIIELPYETNYYYALLEYEELVDSNENKTEKQCTVEDLEQIEWLETIPELQDRLYIWQKTEFKYYNDPNQSEEEKDKIELENDAEELIKPYINNYYIRLTTQSEGLTLYYSTEIDTTNIEDDYNKTGFPQNPPLLPISPDDEQSKGWSKERMQDTEIKKYWVWSTQRSYIEELNEGNKIKSKYIYTTPKLENSESDIVSWCIKNGTTIITGDTVATGTVLAQRLSSEILTSLNYNPKDLEYNREEEMPFATQGTIFNLNEGTIQTKNFKVDKDGNIKLKGIIEAEAGGKIGKWHIASSGIWYDDSDEILTQTSDLYFGIGQQFQVGENTAWPQTISLSLKIKNNFGIGSVDGTVYARGKIMATSGEIGNGNKKWIISSAEGGNSYIYSGSNSIAPHGGIASVDVNNIYIGTDGISCSSTTSGSGYDTVVKSGLITTIYQGNSATYIRPDGIYFSYSQYKDFSDSNPASSNIVGSLTRYGTAVNLQLQGWIKGATSIDATGNITTTGNIYGVVGDSSNKKDVYADDIYANYINNTVKIYNPNLFEYQSLPNYINSIVSLNYITESEFNSLQDRVTALENKISNVN